MWELDDILEQSLSQIAAGKARVESCLLSYPTMADQLQPLLLAAQELRSIPKPVLSPAAKARLEAQVLAAAAADPRLRPAGRRPLWGAMLRWRWAFNALTALLLVVVLLMTTLVTASADALPGAPLYGFKRAAEEAWLWLTPERYEPELHLRLAHRRLQEIEALAAQDRFDASLLESMAGHVDQSLAAVEELPPALALPVLDEMTELLEDQQQVLVGLMDDLPAASRQVVEIALAENADQAARAGSLKRSLHSPQLPPPATTSPTIVPADSMQVTQTPTPTLTLAPSPSPTIAPSQEPAATPTGTATPEPTATPASEPTSSTSSQPAPNPQPAPTNTPPPPPPAPTNTQPPPPPPPPADTPAPPPEPADTRVPPGLTKTPQPPGRTKTPNP